jgi:hypothetical protein
MYQHVWQFWMFFPRRVQAKYKLEKRKKSFPFHLVQHGYVLMFSSLDEDSNYYSAQNDYGCYHG